MPKIDFKQGDVVEVDTARGQVGATRLGILLSDGPQSNHRFLVIVGLTKQECVVTGDVFVPCGEKRFANFKKFTQTFLRSGSI